MTVYPDNSILEHKEISMKELEDIQSSLPWIGAHMQRNNCLAKCPYLNGKFCAVRLSTGHHAAPLDLSLFRIFIFDKVNCQIPGTKHRPTRGIY